MAIGMGFQPVQQPTVQPMWYTPPLELLAGALQSKQLHQDSSNAKFDEYNKKIGDVTPLAGYDTKRAQEKTEEYRKLREEITNKFDGDLTKVDRELRAFEKGLEKDFSSTGELGSIQRGYDKYVAHKEALDKRLADGTITKAAYWDALERPLSEYTTEGISKGFKTTGQYNIFSGKDVPNSIDYNKVLSEFTNGWKANSDESPFIYDANTNKWYIDGSGSKEDKATVLKALQSGGIKSVGKEGIREVTYGEVAQAATQHLMNQPNFSENMDMEYRYAEAMGSLGPESNMTIPQRKEVAQNAITEISGHIAEIKTFDLTNTDDLNKMKEYYPTIEWDAMLGDPALLKKQQANLLAQNTSQVSNLEQIRDGYTEDAEFYNRAAYINGRMGELVDPYAQKESFREHSITAPTYYKPAAVAAKTKEKHIKSVEEKHKRSLYGLSYGYSDKDYKNLNFGAETTVPFDMNLKLQDYYDDGNEMYEAMGSESTLAISNMVDLSPIAHTMEGFDKDDIANQVHRSIVKRAGDAGMSTDDYIYKINNDPNFEKDKNGNYIGGAFVVEVTNPDGSKRKIDLNENGNRSDAIKSSFMGHTQAHKTYAHHVETYSVMAEELMASTDYTKAEKDAMKAAQDSGLYKEFMDLYNTSRKRGVQGSLHGFIEVISDNTTGYAEGVGGSVKIEKDKNGEWNKKMFSKNQFKKWFEAGLTASSKDATENEIDNIMRLSDQRDEFRVETMRTDGAFANAIHRLEGNMQGWLDEHAYTDVTVASLDPKISKPMTEALMANNNFLKFLSLDPEGENMEAKTTIEEQLKILAGTREDGNGNQVLDVKNLDIENISHTLVEFPEIGSLWAIRISGSNAEGDKPFDQTFFVPKTEVKFTGPNADMINDHINEIDMVVGSQRAQIAHGKMISDGFTLDAPVTAKNYGNGEYKPAEIKVQLRTNVWDYVRDDPGQDGITYQITTTDGDGEVRVQRLQGEEGRYTIQSLWTTSKVTNALFDNGLLDRKDTSVKNLAGKKYTTIDSDGNEVPVDALDVSLDVISPHANADLPGTEEFVNFIQDKVVVLDTKRLAELKAEYKADPDAEKFKYGITVPTLFLSSHDPRTSSDLYQVILDFDGKSAESILKILQSNARVMKKIGSETHSRFQETTTDEFGNVIASKDRIKTETDKGQLVK